MYLHICHDDKFLDYFIDNVGFIDPAQNHYWANLRRGCSEFMYIRSKQVKPFKAVDKLVAEYKHNYEGKIRTIFIHYLNDTAISFLDSIDTTGINVVWFFWGADGYRFSKLSGNLYLSETKAHVKKTTADRFSLRRFISNIRTDMKQRNFDTRFRKVLRKITYCASWVKGDYDLIVKYNNRMKFLFFSYYSVEQIVGKDLYAMNLKEPASRPGSILVGNSAYPTNNHLDAFSLLIRNNWKGKVICPLSYGSPESYKAEVLRQGHHLFGQQFQPIKDFMDKDSYNKILADVDLVLMNQTRQQGGGNVLTSIWLGKKVFFNRQSTLFNTFRDLGVAVYTTDQFKDECTTLTADQIQANRTIVEGYMGNEQIRDCYRKLYTL